MWASVDHESAASWPRIRSRIEGTAAAQIPNAPSTWTQAPRSCAIGISSASGSKAPVFTLPACVQTIVGPSIVASASRSASGRIRPWSSDAIRRTRSPSRPRPSIWSEAYTVTCVPAWVTTVTGGAPCRPCRSTSQPARASTPWRAAARAVKLAIVAPVTNPTLVPAGRPSSSTSQLPATSSATAAAGERTYRPAFWSQVEVSQSAPSAAGRLPPTTNPK